MELSRKRYVVGFLFSEDRRKVILIKKIHPEWQEGYFNGVGGRIEPREGPIVAMRREFKEAAGLYIEGWEEVALTVCPTAEIIFFRAFADLDGIKAYDKSLTVEVVHVFRSLPLDEMVWPSQWIVGMCLDDELRFPVRMEYKTDGRKRCY